MSPAQPSRLPIASDVLKEESEALLRLANQLDTSFDQAVELILQNTGKGSGRVICSGIGKSGLVARKIAATLASLGTPSLFVHPTEAFHGDLGMLSENDVALLLSHSGDSDELLRLLPNLRIRNIPIILMTSRASSELAEHSHVVLLTGVQKEACSMNLAPTTSTTVSMALGDALAVALVNARGFTAEDFAYLHPGGSLGRRLLARVGDFLIPRTKVGQAHEGELVTNITERMSISRLGLVAITDDGGRISGVITDGDLRRSLQNPGQTPLDSLTAGEIMTKNPKVISPTKLITEAVYLAEKNRILSLLVVDESTRIFLGVVNLHDLLGSKSFINGDTHGS